MNTKSNQNSKKGQKQAFTEKASSNIFPPVKNEMFGVGITNETRGNILEYVKKSVRNSSENYYIVTPNPEILTYALSHPSFQLILNRAKLALCDGVGLILAGRLLGRPFQERFTGVDFVEKVCEKSNVWPITVGFLGGRGNVAEQAAECLLKKYPLLKIAFVGEEWGDEGFVRAQRYFQQEHLPQTKKQPPTQRVTRHTIDILFVALGFPKQEEWMAEHINRVPVRVMIGVGGAFDYISGKVQRAPKPVRSIGFEWLFRLVRQPWRLKRQLALIRFAQLALAARFARTPQE